MYGSSVLDQVFYQVASDMAKDSAFVERFRKLTFDKVTELLPATRESTLVGFREPIP